MTEISSALIKELREKTAAGMMDCKKALLENNCDIQAACDWLRKKGIVKAASKSSRVAASGLVSAAVSEDGTFGVIVEVNAETDFVAKNEMFQKLVRDITDKAIKETGDFEKVESAVKDDIAQLISTIGENMNLRRIQFVNGNSVYKYVHNCLCTDMGQIAVIMALNGDITRASEIGPKLAMHIAANKPEFATIDDVDPVAVEREKKIFLESGVTNGKPENIIENMIAGRIKKYYGESVFTEQPFVMDPNKTVKQILADNGVTLAGFAYYLLGEGIEKRDDNLADEVAKMLK